MEQQDLPPAPQEWKLTHGIHGGTLTSRDSGNPETFATEAEALAALENHRAFYRTIGYVIWFSSLECPDGTKIDLGGDCNYR